MSARLRAAAADRSYTTEAAWHLGPAAVAVGAFHLAGAFLGVAVDGLREQGRLGLLPRMLGLQAVVAARLADWTIAGPAADEARRLANELNQPVFAAAGDSTASLIAGMRGDEDAAEEGAARAEAVGLPAGANVLVAQAQFGRVLAALGAGRPIEAYEIAERLFDPADPAYHPVISSWMIGDLAEAALHLDRVEEARVRVEQVETAAGESPGSWIALGLNHARALLADDSEAEERFQAALSADFARWPFQRARAQLAYGQWLRRRRRISDSRDPLRAARDAFDALGCPTWGGQARGELRASGESSRRRVPESRDQLTAQELQVAQLAAKGLSNREIGREALRLPADGRYSSLPDLSEARDQCARRARVCALNAPHRPTRTKPSPADGARCIFARRASVARPRPRLVGFGHVKSRPQSSCERKGPDRDQDQVKQRCEQPRRRAGPAMPARRPHRAATPPRAGGREQRASGSRRVRRSSPGAR